MIEMLAALNLLLVKMRTGNMGWRLRSSHEMKATISATAAPKPRVVFLDTQPHSGASMMVRINAVITAMDRPSPGQSSAGASTSFESGTSNMVPMIAMMTTGTLM